MSSNSNIDFSGMYGKAIRHVFVPADQRAVTFVFVDGYRRSLGADVITDFVAPEGVEGATVNSASNSSEFTGDTVIVHTDKGELRFKHTGELVELPE